MPTNSMNNLQDGLKLAEHFHQNPSGHHKIVLSQPNGDEEGIEKVVIRPIQKKNHIEFKWESFVNNQSFTKIHPSDFSYALFAELLNKRAFKSCIICLGDDLWQIRTSKKQKIFISKHRNQSVKPPLDGLSHNHNKPVLISPNAPFLSALGLITTTGQVTTSHNKKLKQINRFIELFSHHTQPLLTNSTHLRVRDFGAGKGYLTFAIQHFLSTHFNGTFDVKGVEIRSNLVEIGNKTVEKLGVSGLCFEAGNVQNAPEESIDVLVALHACDTATDYAINHGIRSEAKVILCAPCCHKELRHQISSPPVLKGLLSHGIHKTQQAEMLTDTIRCLVLQLSNYEAKIIEFIDTEHTHKNKMIVAIKRRTPLSNARASDYKGQLQDTLSIFGSPNHTLVELMKKHHRQIKNI